MKMKKYRIVFILIFFLSTFLLIYIKIKEKKQLTNEEIKSKTLDYCRVLKFDEAYKFINYEISNNSNCIYGKPGYEDVSKLRERIFLLAHQSEKEYIEEIQYNYLIGSKSSLNKAVLLYNTAFKKYPNSKSLNKIGLLLKEEGCDIDTHIKDIVSYQKTSEVKRLKKNEDSQQTDEYVPQTQQVLMQTSNSLRVHSGASTIDNTNRTSNIPTSAQQSSNNPFGTGGSGGVGQGVIDRDEGTGRGEGTGRNIKRERIKDPNPIGIPSDERGKVVVRVKVDEYGNVFGEPTYDRNLTTISNIIVINKVIQLVKQQAKWSSAPGSEMFMTAITIYISPK
jgi:hypothetical protein